MTRASNSSASTNCGSNTFRSKPKGLFLALEAEASERWGPKPGRPGLIAMGTDVRPVPVPGSAANFSPVLRIAPPHFGRVIAEVLGTCMGAGETGTAIWGKCHTHLDSPKPLMLPEDL